MKAAGSAFEGLWYAREGNAASQGFDEGIRQRFAEGPTIFSSNGYDAVRMLTFVSHQSEPRAALETLSDFKGASGTLATLPDHSFSSEVRLMMVKEGKFTARQTQ